MVNVSKMTLTFFRKKHFRRMERQFDLFGLPTDFNGSVPFLVICALVGCSSPRPTSQEHYVTSQVPSRTNTTARIDQRLLEKTDEPASDTAADQAKTYHNASSFAKRYPTFVYCRLLVHGGYSAKFRGGFGAYVIHYFDSQGHIMMSEKWWVN